MVQSILVPLDGSLLSLRAVPYADVLAERTGAKITLLTVLADPVAIDPDLPGRQRRVSDEVRAELQRVAAQIKRPECATVVNFGEVNQTLLDEVRARGIDLIVMATHGTSGLGRWVTGSNASALLQDSPVPVLLVRAWQEEQGLDLVGSQPKMLVPLDGSLLAEAALPLAAELALQTGAAVVLFRCVPMPDNVRRSEAGPVVAYRDQELEALKNEAEDYLRDVGERFFKGAAALERDVQAGRPAPAILKASREHQAALVVMATHGRSGLGRTLLGSVADRVLREGLVPVLLLGPACIPSQMGESER